MHFPTSSGSYSGPSLRNLKHGSSVRDYAIEVCIPSLYTKESFEVYITGSPSLVNPPPSHSPTPEAAPPPPAVQAAAMDLMEALRFDLGCLR